jgi:hypothetical protein
MPAITQHDRREVEKARPGLEKALELLDALLRDHRDHPKACDIEATRSDVLIRLGRHAEAVAAAEDAVTLARREAEKPGAPNTARGDVVSAERQLGEARRALWCWRLDLDSKVLLGVLAVFLLSKRPWRALTPRLGRLALGLLLADLALAGLGVLGAEYVARRERNPDSLMTDGKAFVLVLVPGAIGIVVALATALSYKGRRGALLAVALALAGTLAASICLVQHYGFFNAFLPGI